MEHRISPKIQEALDSRKSGRLPEQTRKKFKFSRLFMIGNVVLLVVVFAVVLNFMRDNPYTTTAFSVGSISYRFTANINKEGNLNLITTMKSSANTEEKHDFTAGVNTIIIFAEGKEIKRFAGTQDKITVSFSPGETRIFSSELTKADLTLNLLENGIIEKKNKTVSSFIKRFVRMKAVFIINKPEPVKTELEFTAGV